MRGPWAPVLAPVAAVAALILVTAPVGAAGQLRVNVPAPSAVRPIVPVLPGNPGYPGTLSIRPPGSIRCRRICVKFGRGTPTHPAVCLQWRTVC